MLRLPCAPNRSARRLGAGLALAVAAAIGQGTFAPPARAEAPAESADNLFNEGLTLMAARDFTRALYRFKRSFELSPKYDAAMNAALCLKELKRYDEALELSETLITRFSSSLTEADRRAIIASIKYFLIKVGSLEILGNEGARVSIDGRDHGVLPLDGPVHLMPGERKVRVAKAGFDPFETTRDITAGEGAIINVALKPSVPSAPAPRSHAIVTAFGGYTLSPSLSSTAEAQASSAHTPSVHGALVGARVGYGFSTGITLEISFGYLYVASSFQRSIANVAFDDPTLAALKPVYDLTDHLSLQGPFLGFGASYRIPLNPRFSVMTRISGGVLSARSQHALEGTVKVGDMSAAVFAEPQKRMPLSSQPGFIMPEVGLEAAWGSLHAGVILGFIFFPASGPVFNNRYLGVQPSCSAAAPVGVGCVPNEPIAEGEQRASTLYGTFWSAVPQLSVSYSF